MIESVPQINCHISGDKTQTIFGFQGNLDVHSSAALWTHCFEQLEQTSPDKLIIDGQHLLFCDGAGISLINTLKQFQISHGKTCEVVNLKPNLLKILDIFSQTITINNQESPQVKLDWVSAFGQRIVSIGRVLKTNLTFTGELIYYSFQTILHPKRMRWKDAWQFVEATGPNALPIILLLGFLIGMIMSYQGAIPLEKFGAKMYVPNFVGITLLRELGPLLTAVIVIGRSASAFAAELGSMKMNQEVDALHTMGIEVMQFLVVPRVFATMLMLPVLNIFMVLAGLIGCGMVSKSLGISVGLYINQLASALTVQDLLGGLFKALVFGIVVGAIGCMHGLRAYGGAMGVGRSTTQTVVSGITMLVIIDGLFAMLFFSLKL